MARIIKKNIFANRGLTFERYIENANGYYKNNGICLVRKIPTPIRVVKSDEKGMIVNAFYEKRSALDFNGVWKGYHLDFDTKQTSSKTSFSLSLIQEHQMDYAREIIKYNGIAFFLIRFYAHDEVYLLTLREIDRYLLKNQGKKSIPYPYFKEELSNFLIKKEYKGNYYFYDYIKVLEKMI